MKISKKVVSLIKHGLSGELISSLNEGQINSLFNRLVESKKENKEAVTKTSTTTTYDLGNPADVTAANKALGGTANIDPVSKKMIVTKEGEMTEDSGLEDLALGDEAGGMNPDKALALSMTEKKEMDEKFESKSQQKLFWARCGEGKTKEEKKWCKMAKEFSQSTSKKQYEKMPEKKHPEKSVPKSEYVKETNEGYLDMIGKAINNGLKSQVAKTGPNMSWGTKLEHKISQLVEKNLNPKMTKKDLIKLVKEQGTETAEPTTKPKTPTTPKPTTPKPDFDPFINPDPSDDPEARTKIPKHKGLDIFMGQVKKKNMLRKK